jgi:hypothetical protein
MVDPSLERIDREAIDDWCDRRSGRQGASAAPDDLAPTHPGDAPSADAASDPWVKAANELRDAKARN